MYYTYKRVNPYDYSHPWRTLHPSLRIMNFFGEKKLTILIANTHPTPYPPQYFFGKSKTELYGFTPILVKLIKQL